jgi:hypothetical protein
MAEIPGRTIDLTCGHCGHEWHFYRKDFTDEQLRVLACGIICDHCGESGAAMVLSSHPTSHHFPLEHSPG